MIVHYVSKKVFVWCVRRVLLSLKKLNRIRRNLMSAQYGKLVNMKTCRLLLQTVTDASAFISTNNTFLDYLKQCIHITIKQNVHCVVNKVLILISNNKFSETSQWNRLSVYLQLVLKLPPLWQKLVNTCIISPQTPHATLTTWFNTISTCHK